jgi:hypothetical protein
LRKLGFKSGDIFVELITYRLLFFFFSQRFFSIGKSSLTPTEIDHGITAEWVEISRALEIFGRYDEMREDWRSLYLREFTVLNKFLQRNDHRK